MSRVRLHESEVGARATIRPYLEALGVEIAAVRPTLPPVVEADPGLLTDLVLWNLSSDPEVLAREVRYLLSDPELHGLPFVAVLAGGELGLEMSLLEGGCEVVLHHPLSLADLASTLQEIGIPASVHRSIAAVPPTGLVVSPRSAELGEILRADSHVVLEAGGVEAACAIASRLAVDYCLVDQEIDAADPAGFADRFHRLLPDAYLMGLGAPRSTRPGEMPAAVVPADAGPDELRDVVARVLRERLDRLKSRELTGEIAAKQRELQRINETLRSVNKAIRDTNIRLERQGHEKDEMIGVAAHELKSPLAAVAGALDILTRDMTRFGSADAELVTIIQRNNVRMIKLVNDILDLSRLEAGKITLKTKAYTSAPLIDQALSTVTVRARSKGVRFHVMGDGQNDVIRVDGERVVQMLVNLIDNAVKFSPQGGIVSIAVKADRRRFHFVVSDQGPGIPEEERQLIFERFHHKTRGEDLHAAGSGLGLTITAALAKLLGGHVVVGESPEGGARFTMTLPLDFDQEGSHV